MNMEMSGHRIEPTILREYDVKSIRLKRYNRRPIPLQNTLRHIGI